MQIHGSITVTDSFIAIHPPETHPDVILYAIASRDADTAAKSAKSYAYKKSYGSYQALLEDPEVDFVYISVPNGLHYEWASKALKAGKHVLLEKPFTSNAAEAEALVREAEQTNLVLEEAFHWQFHPAAHLWRALVESGEYGRQIISTNAKMTASPGVPDGDIRWQFDLAGGSLMDATYTLSFTRYILRAGMPEKILSAVARPYDKDKRVDAAMTTTLLFKDQSGESVHSRVDTDIARGWLGGVIPRVWELPQIEVETDKCHIVFYNAMMPHLYHYISITDKANGTTTYKHQYSGGPVWGNVQTSAGVGGASYWSTYRYQLEAFISKLQGGQPAYWVTNEESIKQMQTIDQIYSASGLPIRPGRV
ncbi:hypothetical protein PV11_00051 [Exophiala sideris]|uniref:D-xylose 1-dehydrogenase (NADP(+), D-xylono-1,5-lactone-forming) n=1 Tax=Exophiala sideris TaxID=1016849 RepID=A0A0D1X8V9_9EURO|nr:hypothetical protein PV11_00051 [Exophiala sideris]